MARRIYAVLATLWLAFLAIHEGHVYDEAEHLHAAWLIERMGRVPIRDFFQHHQPVLWDALGLYFRIGGEGPGGLYFGRLLVVLAGLLSLWGLYALGTDAERRIDPSDDGDRGRPEPRVAAGLLAGLFFIVATVVHRSLFVIRPETVSIPLIVGACVLWARRPPGRIGRRASDFGAGGLFALAVFSSPRFLLLMGLFALPALSAPGGGRSPYGRLLRRHLSLLLGAATALLGYLWLSSTSVGDVRFNLAFSAILQWLGEGNVEPVRTLLVIAILVGSSWLLVRRPPRQGRKTRLLAVGYALAVTVVSVLGAGRYLYAQDFAAPVVLVAVLLARQPPFRIGTGRFRRHLPAVGLGLAAASLAGILALGLRADRTLLREVRFRRVALWFVEEGDRVLLTARLHPIAAPDASYYAHPLTDSPGRLCRAVALARERWSLPECDFASVLREERPRLVDALLPAVVRAEARTEVEEVLQEAYVRQGPFYIRDDSERLRDLEGPSPGSGRPAGASREVGVDAIPREDR